ncbi:hypothetical protein RJ639_040841 [Escallonia herrerae]|uniref:NAC domain-containing protein n=1 Tax=Escallonia herrerae TaxID=1293975 RepID=A0AA88WP74_9ASTE|nr:hypothetical protein RJ639_040841 [Escallonia herrerae]
MEVESCVPPGFRFHPTEEELVGYYLTRKVHSLKIDLDVIVDLDLYRMEPWDIEGDLIQEEGWVVCRAFKKPTPNQKQGFEAWNNSGYCFRGSGNFRPPSFQHTSNPMHAIGTNRLAMDFRQSSTTNQDLEEYTRFDNQLVDLPQLDSPTLSTCCLATMDGFELNNLISTEEHDQGWKNVDNLPALEQIQQPPFSYSKLPSIPRDDELDFQSHLSHLLGYFPDL